MFEKIEDLLKGYAREASEGVKDIPSGKAEGVSNAAVNSIMGLFKDKVSTNEIAGLTDMFKDKNAINNTASQATGDFVQRLETMGINMETGKKIATAILPLILSKFSGGSASKGGLNDILSQFGGGDITAALGGILGGKKGKSDEGGILGKMKDLF